VNVRRTEIRVVHGADADEPNGGTGLRVVPNRNPAHRAASNLPTLAARRGRPDEFGLTGRVYDTIGFIESVERMRCACLTLAPRAVAWQLIVRMRLFCSGWAFKVRIPIVRFSN